MNTHFVVVVNDVVTMYGDVPEDSPMLLQPGVLVAAEPFTPQTHYYLGGAVLSYTEAQAAAKAAVPAEPNAVWSDAAMSWVDPWSLPTHKRVRWQFIKASAQRDAEANITIGGKEYATDPVSRAALFQKAQIAQLATADGLPFSVDWELVDGTGVTLSFNQLKAGIRAIDDRTEQIRAAARAKKVAIEACTTVAEVLAITWP